MKACQLAMDALAAGDLVAVVELPNPRRPHDVTLYSPPTAAAEDSTLITPAEPGAKLIGVTRTRRDRGVLSLFWERETGEVWRASFRGDGRHFANSSREQFAGSMAAIYEVMRQRPAGLPSKARAKKLFDRLLKIDPDALREDSWWYSLFDEEHGVRPYRRRPAKPS